ncbi:MAG: lipid-A-disaccharide synthase [Candidatus Berkiella sp.]
MNAENSAAQKICFGIVAGEISGDILGADLIAALKETYPDATFVGIGGERMIKAGMQTLFPMERLSVMGFIEPLKRLPELLRIRSFLKQYFIKHKPTVFIGIDAPDFNLSLELYLKKHGVRTVHYVSPTVWAWRKGRIHKIKKAVNRMLCVFPFESPIYEEYQVPMTFVGHPLADEIPMDSSKSQARTILDLPQEKKIVALLPGSRAQEIAKLGQPFIETARWLKANFEEVEFISPLVNESIEEQFKAQLACNTDVKVKCFKGNARTVMAAADVVLTVSGTASLEAMLVKRPTIVAYKMSKLGFVIAKRIIHVPYIALPNLLAGKLIMKEFIQEAVKPEAMGKAILAYLMTPELSEQDSAIFSEIHESLRKDAGKTAASAIREVIKENEWQSSVELMK